LIPVICCVRYTGLKEEVCVREQDCKWVGKQEEVISPLRNIPVALYTYCISTASVSAPVSKVSVYYEYFGVPDSLEVVWFIEWLEL
jgi:hypothetical protein